MVTLNASVADHNPMGWRFDNTYSRLPDVLFAPAMPARLAAPRLLILNRRLADELGLDLSTISPESAAALFAGQDLPSGSQPIAQAYAGHQFGNFTMLGDGRAILLGEHRTPSGHLVDIHGVMNTDNMAISGETIDYGPCAFMNAYRPNTVFSSIDHAGRYSYGNQPAIAQWNLARFAETLLPHFAPEQEQAVAIASEALGQFPALFEGYWLAGMRVKLGLQSAEAGDLELVRSLLAWMQKAQADFTNTFRDLSSTELPAGDRYADPDFLAWYSQWQLRLSRENRPSTLARAAMRGVNPGVIPRNHRVEEALSAAEDHDDLSVLHRLLEALAMPYEAGPELAAYQEPPPDDCSYRTFCGT